jgi:hypothetical protein
MAKIRIYTGTVYGKAESPIVTTGKKFLIRLLITDQTNDFSYLIKNVNWNEGHHGNEADLNCECTILIKDHDVGLPDFASFPTIRNNLVRII